MTSAARTDSLREPGRPERERGGMEAFRHLYVHIPFCRHKCGYCDFNAYAGMDRLIPEYVDALEKELAFARERHAFQQLETVYLGGGTPSLLPPADISRLLRFIRETFNVSPDAEVTLEANPGSTDEPRIAAWLEGGVNRLSLGVQGFDPRALAVLERRTDAAQARRAFAMARRLGMTNVSVDLIYAVPHQTPETWVDTLRQAVELEPEHVSTYCLSFEEGTLLVSSPATTRRTGAAARCTGQAPAPTPTPQTASGPGAGGTWLDPASTSAPCPRSGRMGRSSTRARGWPRR